MRRLKIFSMTLAGALATACSSVDAKSSPPDARPLCSAGSSLGKVEILPVTRWRPDQKEPARREAIALRAIQTAASATCLKGAHVASIAPESSAAAELTAAKDAGFDTAVIVRVEELGPILILSIPVLWSGWSDVKFNVTTKELKTGATTASVDHHRKVGGPFILRGVVPVEGEFVTALTAVFEG